MAYPFFPMISATGATLASYYHRLREHGLNDSHSGNAFVRINDSAWITPAGACGDDFSSSDLGECRLVCRQRRVPVPALLYSQSSAHSHRGLLPFVY